LDLKDIVDSTSPPEELKLGGYTYFTSFYHRVVFNDNNWVVLEDNIANFTGGAHGMYSNTYQNLDLSISKKWSLRDIVKDTATLQPLLEIAARNYFGIKNEEDISERLLVETIPVTPNVYITSSGLFFVYQPYEIASYADGLISLYIPYNQIISLLSPPFLKRMGLDTQAGVAMLN
jgi:hypothetical protein